jgi:hypothetical protein
MTMLKFVRWDYKDVFTHDPLRIRDDFITFDDVIGLDEGHLW